MILGAVLAGGQARRFGSDKALARWRGVALIDHAIAHLAGVADAVAVCGRRHGTLPAIADRPAAGLGPLGGLCGALHHAAGHGFARVVTLSCDTPVLADGLLAALIAGETDAYLAGSPVIGCWSSGHAALLEAHLAGEDRSMRGWARRVGAVALDRPAPPNVNRPEDLARLDASLASGR